MTLRSRIALAFALLMGISACDTTTTTPTTPTTANWSVTPTVDHSYLSSAEYSAATSFYAAALRSSGALITSNTSTSGIPSLSIPSTDTMVKIYVAGMKGSDTLWSGFSYFVKDLAGSTILVTSTGSYTPPVTVVDNTPLYDQGGTLEAGAQGAALGSFISVRGDIDGPFVTNSTNTAGNTSEQALVDLSFFAMSGASKSTTGTPSFVSPSVVNTTWGTTNKTIIKKTLAPSSQFTTVQDIIDELGSSTSTQATAEVGANYVLKLSNGKYALLMVTSIAGSTGGATVVFRLKTTNIPSSNPGSTGDQTAVKDQGGILEAGAQTNSYAGSFISIRGDKWGPEGFVLSSGEKTAEDEAAIDLSFFAMSGTSKSNTGTPSFVSSNLVNTSWGTTNKTIIKELVGYTASEFKTVQDIIDALGSATSTQAAAVAGGLYALKLSNGTYAVIQVTSLIGTSGSAAVSFKIIK